MAPSACLVACVGPAALLAAALPYDACAADWSFQPALTSRIDYHSNRRLQLNADPSQGVWLTLDALLARKTATLDLSLVPQINLQRFVNESRLDSDNGGVTLAGRWRLQYSELGFSARASRDSTLTSELEETGIVDAQTQRETRSGMVSWSHRLSPQRQLGAQVALSEVDYPGGERFGLIGYRYLSGGSSFAMLLSEYTTLSAIAFGGRLEAPESRTESRDAGLRFTLDRKLSPYTQASVSAGLSESRTDTFFGSRKDRNEVWNASLSHAGEFTQWSFSWDRSVAASGRGVLTRRDVLACSIRRGLSSLLSGGLTLRGTRNEDLLYGVIPVSRDYMTVEGNLSRRISPSWALNVNAGLLRSKFDGASVAADGWYGAVGARWTPAQRTISR